MITWTESIPDARVRDIAHWDRALPTIDEMYKAAGDQPVIVWRESGYHSILAHLSDAPEERGGLLLGAAYQRAVGEEESTLGVIDVIAAVPAPTQSGTAVSLSMGVQLWDAARDVAKQLQRDESLVDEPIVVGWYHSHPGLGAFFSGTDRATQKSFFREPWHVGVVIDPRQQEVAWFLGPDSESISPSAIVMA